VSILARGRRWPLVLLLSAGAASWLAGSAQAAAPGDALASYAERYAASCAACHGANGVSTQALVPSLAGQPSFYAVTQLFLFRGGRRDNPAMTAVAQGMSDADLRGFSEHIGKLAPANPAPAAGAATPPDKPALARGAALARQLHCTGCHGSDLAGGKQVPRLAGQREDYLLHALQGFRSAQRIGYTPAMSEALAGVSADALADLALFLSRFNSADAAAGSR